MIAFETFHGFIDTTGWIDKDSAIKRDGWGCGAVVAGCTSETTGA